MSKQWMYILLLIPPIILSFLDFSTGFNIAVKSLSILTIITCVIGLIRHRKHN